MTRWTKEKIYRVEMEKARNDEALIDKLVDAYVMENIRNDDDLIEKLLERYVSERTEDVFGDLCDRAYDEKRDRDMEREYDRSSED